MAHSADFEFRAPGNAGDARAGAAMRDLANRVLPVYQDESPDRYLANLSALQLVAGTYGAADSSRKALRDRRSAGTASSRPDPRELLVDLYAHVRAVEADQHVPFAQAFTQAFQETVPKLGDRDAYGITAWMGAPPASFQEALQRAFDRLRGRDRIEQADAIHLAWTYLAFDAWRSMGPLLDTLGGDDDRQRYATDEDVTIKTADGVELHARVVRPKNAPARMPALLEFTLFPSPNDARASAAHGYAGVVVYARGLNANGGHAGPVTPFEHDGEDARAAIQWITRQPWSDGRVGMFGGSYSGFTAWAAAKQPPKALKAIATLDAMAPGIDFPMPGHIFRNTAYRWALTNAAAPDEAPLDDERWRAVDKEWYRSGKRYRLLDRVAAKPSPVFKQWLDHPAYDGYWQRLIPFREEFAAVDIPVLAMTGDAGAAGTLYYFGQHLRHRPDADHTLLIGAYDDSTLLDGPSAVLRGYPADAVALLDLRELRCQWFDHVLKGSALPAVLASRVNYEVMGANEWRHADSLDAAANGKLRFYLDATLAGGHHSLVADKPSATGFVAQAVNLADRRDADLPPSTDLVSRKLDAEHGKVYVSAPLMQPLEVAGLLSGRLDFAINKADADVNVALYELRENGDYVEIFDRYDFRASYARDDGKRKLLSAGKRQQVPFAGAQFAARRLQAGSRVVLVLGINRQPDRQVNYGTGKNVSDESIADAKAPVKLRWYASSYVEIPVRREAETKSEAGG